MQDGEGKSELLPGRIACRHWISEKGTPKGSKKERRRERDTNCVLLPRAPETSQCRMFLQHGGVGPVAQPTKQYRRLGVLGGCVYVFPYPFLYVYITDQL